MPVAIARLAARDALNARFVNAYNLKGPERHAPAVDVIQHLIQPINQKKS